MSYYATRHDVTDEIDWEDGDVDDVLREYAENTAQGFGPYSDNPEGLKRALYQATIQKSNDLDGEIDDLERKVNELEQLRSQLDSTYDHEINDIVDEAWSEYAPEEEEEEDEE